jgi:hypothetical protein
VRFLNNDTSPNKSKPNAQKSFCSPLRPQTPKYEQSIKENNQRKAYADAAAFFGVAFFLGVALAAGFGVVLVTRPDLVLLRTAGFSAAAGAWRELDAIMK